MPRVESPKISIKLELTLPNGEGPPKKFLVNRPLKSKWSGDHKRVSQEILEEIKTYSGSFVSDLTASLAAVVANENMINSRENKRSRDVEKWSVHLIESLLTASVKEKLFSELYEIFEVPEWDGTEKEIEAVDSKELSNVDSDRIAAMLAPRVKHILYLISKNMKSSKDS